MERRKRYIIKGTFEKRFLFNMVLVLLISMAIAGCGKSKEAESVKENSNVNDMSYYIPLGKQKVEEFVKAEHLNSEMDSWYSSDDITIILDEDGFINVMMFKSNKYSLYGLKVGDTFDIFVDSSKLTDHKYDYITLDEGTACFGVTTGVDTPGGDRLILIEIDEDNKISRMTYQATGAQELIDGLTDEIMDEMGVDSDILEETQAAEEQEMSFSDDEYIISDSDFRQLQESDLVGFTQEELRLAKNEIYARHGRIFTSEDLINYFSAKDWYEGTIDPNDFSEDLLNQVEKDNVKLIAMVQEQGFESPEQDLASEDLAFDYNVNEMQWQLGCLNSERIEQMYGEYRKVENDGNHVTLDITLDGNDFFKMKATLWQGDSPEDEWDGELFLDEVLPLVVESSEEKLFTLYNPFGLADFERNRFVIEYLEPGVFKLVMSDTADERYRTMTGIYQKVEYDFSQEEVKRVALEAFKQYYDDELKAHGCVPVIGEIKFSNPVYSEYMEGEIEIVDNNDNEFISSGNCRECDGAEFGASGRGMYIEWTGFNTTIIQPHDSEYNVIEEAYMRAYIEWNYEENRFYPLDSMVLIKE